MHSMKNTALCRIKLALVLVVAGMDCFACKFRQVGLEEHARLEETVFVAVAETASNGMSGKGPDVPAKMRVLKAIKGKAKAGDLVDVYTSNSSCGLAIQAGHKWLILGSGNPLHSDQPSGSILLLDQQARDYASKGLGITLE